MQADFLEPDFRARLVGFGSEADLDKWWAQR